MNHSKGIRHVLASNYLTFLISALAGMGSYGALYLMPAYPEADELLAVFKVGLLSAIFVCFCLFFYGLNVHQHSVEKRKSVGVIGLEPALTAVIQADANGKTYSKYRLITKGPNSGKYESVPSFHATRTGLRDTVAEAERRDILESGFEIQTPDPKSSK
jgi:hypothetical protein